MKPPVASSGRSTGEARGGRTPSAVSRHHFRRPDRAWRSSRTGISTKRTAARAKLAASRRATGPPPYRAKSPAATSGATSFIDSFAVIRSPLKVPIRPASSVVAASACSAASWTAPWAPYSTSTANSSHTRSADSTHRRTGSRSAIAAFRTTSSGRRRTRSASVPSSGPSRTGAHRAKAASAARLSEPVRDLTQIPETSHMAVVPNPDTTTPVRYQRMTRSLVSEEALKDRAPALFRRCGARFSYRSAAPVTTAPSPSTGPRRGSRPGRGP
ncbi:hypothetical protein SNARM312S_07980 [Streptomyces narbonensis]